MRRPIVRRTVLAVAATGALATAALAAAPLSEASTLYACVKKNGSAHLYAKKPKCKKGESKLSWGTTGPAGQNGSNGAPGSKGTTGSNGPNGTNGANGAVAGYGAVQSGTINITSEKKLILTKTLPAGSYIVTAKVETAAAGKSEGQMESRCELNDGSTLDESQWISGLSGFIAGTFLGSSTLPLEAPVTITAPTSVQLLCETQLNKATSGEMSATDGKLLAVQTSANS
jgi:hypothetical protein